jgi:hypothetical protein
MSLIRQGFPQFYLTDPNLSNFVDIFESVAQNLYDNMLHLASQRAVKDKEEYYLDYYLAEKGWGLGLDIDFEQKRKLLQYLIPVNKARGTSQIIVDVVNLLYGIELEAILQTPDVEGVWQLGVSRLGYDTYIGDGEDAPYSTLLLYAGEPSLLTDKIKSDIKKIVSYLRPVTFEYIFSWEQEEIESIDYSFRVGVSELGYTTRLG